MKFLSYDEMKRTLTEKLTYKFKVGDMVSWEEATVENPSKSKTFYGIIEKFNKGEDAGHPYVDATIITADNRIVEKSLLIIELQGSNVETNE